MRKGILLKATFAYLLLTVLISCGERANIKPVGLTCEHMENPAVLDIQTPRLSWINEAVSDQIKGEYQSAYRICVASSKDKLLSDDIDIWDSGKVLSSDSYLVSYQGKSLESTNDYYWRVMVWDSRDTASPWSEVGHWGMGLLAANEWEAKWIGAPWQGEAPKRIIEPRPAVVPGAPRPRVQQVTYPSHPAPLFRKSFSLKGEVASAKAFVTGLGYFEFYLNGKRVGDDYLVPNFTNYSNRDMIEVAPIAIDNNFRDHRVMYLAYDVTDMLKKQENVAGAIVGDGFYDSTSRWVASFGSPRFLCQLEVTYKDGSKELICSDESWKVKESPIVMNGVYDGEIYDATKETAGWATVDCDDSGWQNVVLRQAPTGKMTAHTAPTDKIVETLQPVSLTKLEDGTYEVDFGVEISGWIRLKGIRGNKGDTLDVKYICESPLGVQKYIFNGTGNETYAPRFTWYVFSKAIISGINELTSDMLLAEAVNTDVPVTAEFKTSNELFNKINTIWQRSQLDNMHGGIVSDCPHRERSPYTGDGQVACVTVMYNFDAAALYQKWIRDMNDAQNVETGYVPNGAPWQPGCGGGVAWGSAMNIMPWEYYVHYGDRKMLADNYQAMKDQVKYMLTWLTKDGTMYSQRTNINSTQPNYWMNLGDWVSPYENPSEELVHTFYLWRCADFTARAAKALNRNEDYSYFSKVAGDVRNAFNKKFYDAENKTYGDYGSNIFALVVGVPEDRYEDVKNTLRKEITETYGGHLHTGIFGTQFFFETLAAHGMNEVAYEAMNKRDFPSFGHWIEQGATVTWEHWDGRGSLNHPMFGGSLTWFYRTLAGVNTDENEPGFRHIIVKPVITAKMDDVYYSNKIPYGKVVSEIKKKGNGLEMNVTVPVGSHATVYIPLQNPSAVVTESGRALAGSSFMEEVGNENGYKVVKVEQGKYTFAVQ
ncbi:alpha-L-rhamnosidase N-terminal domain-containing protein [Parabacteroides sp. PF5-9]|uniref:alpha-L-rhamnosidase-related protein n=1 Tax=Parabacteroides sp. PF5-9 TaxID=1742404 RepID=UPI00247659D3|nr:alpha-L-rhamnosidase N-terminal domain-containing protein [Parabacteroides sp. PF5-9]MDH6358893.1 alpha-L-rhamnosidase [Parabacteroides sp. PF5-9]